MLDKIDAAEQRLWALEGQAFMHMFEARKKMREAIARCREAEEKYTEARVRAEILDPDGAGC